MLKRIMNVCISSLIVSVMIMGTLMGAGQACAEEPVELLWYHIGTPQADVDKVMEHISEYTKEKIGVTVKMVQLDWGEYEQKMKVMVTAGEPFDLMFTASWALNYREYAQQGAFYDLTSPRLDL